MYNSREKINRILCKLSKGPVLHEYKILGNVYQLLRLDTNYRETRTKNYALVNLVHISDFTVEVVLEYLTGPMSPELLDMCKMKLEEKYKMHLRNDYF